MRQKLQKFTTFANRLLPHETQYLLAVQQLEDEERLAILQRADYNCRHIHQFTPYDTGIDKRKYSNLKKWIVRRLRAIDVDQQFEWMGEMERKIHLDMIQQREEKQLLKAIRKYEHPGFNFVKFYELARQYRHFLLIRMRYADHRLVDSFLRQYETAYNRSRLVSEQMHRATQDIMQQYAENAVESIQWEKWLTDVFYDEELDGNIRYLALIRLNFICFNYRKHELLIEKFDYLDELFRQGAYYSRRLLLNYYDNRLVLHSKLGEFERAIYYGYLSIREKNHDYLTYVNNLCGVLLRVGRYDEALSTMRQASPEMKETKNFHAKTGYVSYYLNCLLRKGMLKNARNYGETFLKAYEKEILQYRWHRFFSSYLEVLLYQEDYRELLRLVDRYKLLERQEKYSSRANYLPTISLYYDIARFREELIRETDFQESLRDKLKALQHTPDRWAYFRELLGALGISIDGVPQSQLVNRKQ